MMNLFYFFLILSIAFLIYLFTDTWIQSTFLYSGYFFLGWSNTCKAFWSIVLCILANLDVRCEGTLVTVSFILYYLGLFVPSFFSRTSETVECQSTVDASYFLYRSLGLWQMEILFSFMLFSIFVKSNHTKL